MGGLARRASLIEQTRDSVEGALLVVDSGNTLMGDPLSLRSEGRVIVHAMNAMGYDALGVGTGELMKGPEVLRQRIGEATFPSIGQYGGQHRASRAGAYAIIDVGACLWCDRCAVPPHFKDSNLLGLASRSSKAKQTLNRYVPDRLQVDVLWCWPG